MSEQNRSRTRAATLEVRECGECGEDKPKKKEVRVSVSSETPCPGYVFDEERREWLHAMEILGHGEGEVDFTRCAEGLVIQDNHGGDQIGLIRSVELTDGKLGGIVEFCAGRRAQEIREDAENGLRRNMSVGYIVDRWEKVSDGEDGGLPVYRAVRWTPFEASFVNIPADVRVGVGRSMDADQPAAPVATTERKAEKMAEPINTPAVEKPAVDAAAERAALIKEIKDEVVTAVRELAPEMPKPAEVRAFDAKEEAQVQKQYDFRKAVMALAGEKVDCGFERECSEQIAKATKRSARGLFIPEAAFRVMTGKTNVEDHIVGAGSNTVATQLLASQFIEALVAKTVLGSAGVQTMSGLVGDIAIPKGDSISAGWVSAEDGDAANGNPTFSQVTMTPHTIAAYTDITRKLMLQSSIDVQGKITAWILGGIARGIETACFTGSGSGGQPLGLDSIVGVQTVTMTTGEPKKANMVEFWQKLYEQNVDGTPKFIMSPAVKALLCKTRDVTIVENKAKSENVGGVGSDYLCTKDGKIEGYDVIMSNLCGAKKIYFGDWSQMLLGFWSGIDLTVDPYSLSTKGALRLVAFQDCDVAVRQPKAFVTAASVIA